MLGRRILRWCGFVEAILIIISIIGNLSIKIPLTCFFIVYASQMVYEILEDKNG